MSKICKEYIAEIKTLFPIKRKQEKEYIKKLAMDVESYCIDADIKDKTELYENYGKPYEVVSNYISTIDTDDVIKRLKMGKFIRAAVIVSLAILTVAVAVFGIYMHHIYRVLEENKIVIVEEVIIEEDPVMGDNVM